MLNTEIEDIKKVIDRLLKSNSRINQSKENKYWYPLSLATYGLEEISECLESLCSFKTSMWEKTKYFEKLFSQYTGSSFALMVNSGSSADLLACQLLQNPVKKRFRDNQEILLPVVTWPTHIWSAMSTGLNVRFVDVDPMTLNISIDDIYKKLNKYTSILFPVHLMGNPCDIDEIQNISDQYNLKLIEDCCEALGAKFNGKHVGNFGIAGTFSFYFSHHITTMEGGMVISNDEENMDELRELRSHGWNRDSSRKNDYLNNSIDVDLRYLFTNYGFNLRPTELQAGFGIHQLAKLDAFTRKRQLLSKIFFEYIDNSSYFHYPKVHPKATPCWFALPLIVSEKASFSKDEFCDYLEKAGVETRPIVTGNFAKQPIAVMLGLKDSDYPGANIIHSRGFYIGLSPMLEENHIYRLIDLFDTFIKKKHG